MYVTRRAGGSLPAARTSNSRTEVGSAELTRCPGGGGGGGMCGDVGRSGGLWRTTRRASLNDGRASVRNACPPARAAPPCQSISGRSVGDVGRRPNNAVIWPRSIIFPGVRAAAAGGRETTLPSPLLPSAVGGTHAMNQSCWARLCSPASRLPRARRLGRVFVGWLIILRTCFRFSRAPCLC